MSTMYFIDDEAENAQAQAVEAENCLVRSDYEGAWRLANLASIQENPLGLYVLGVCYLNGYGTEKNIEKARVLFRMSYERGCTRALTGLFSVDFEEHQSLSTYGVELIRMAAEAKDAKGQYMLALLHDGGAGVVRSLRKYHSLLSQSDAQGYIPAKYRLAQLYLSKDTPYYDGDKGLEMLKVAADAGYSEAQAHLASLILEGLGVEKDEGKAFSMFQEAARKGCTNAMRSLGFCYMYGQGVEKNRQEATDWFRQAAALGESDCEELAELCSTDNRTYKDTLNGPHVKAEFELRDTVENDAKAGKPEGLYQLGVFYLTGQVGNWMPYEQDFAKAEECFLKAAESGYAKAAYTLGDLYQNGYNIVEPDMDKAMGWYKRAAELGDRNAMTNLAFCHYKTGNPALAVEWFEKACAAGDTMAMGMLSFHYFNGEGTAANPERAFSLALESANAGEPEGQKMLGLCYLYGVGTEVDLDMAVLWFTNAVNQGNVVSMRILGRLLMGDFGYQKTDFELAEELLGRVDNSQLQR